MLFRGLRKANVAPPTLELGNVWNGVPIDRLDKHWLEPVLNRRPFRNLTTLKLYLTLELYPFASSSEWTRQWQGLQSRYHAKMSSFLDSLYTALQDAPLIHTLSLSIRNTYPDQQCLGAQVFETLNDGDREILLHLKTLELRLAPHKSL